MPADRLLRLSLSAVVYAACSSGGADQPPADQPAQHATLPQKLCELLPQAEAERIMGKPLVEQRNDDAGCNYQDAAGTTGTGLSVFTNVLTVRDQCGMTPASEPLTGLGDEACIALQYPAGIYTTVVFGRGGQTFEVVAPGQDRGTELATAAARAIVSKLGS